MPTGAGRQGTFANAEMVVHETHRMLVMGGANSWRGATSQAALITMKEHLRNTVEPDDRMESKRLEKS